MTSRLYHLSNIVAFILWMIYLWWRNPILGIFLGITIGWAAGAGLVYLLQDYKNE